MVMYRHSLLVYLSATLWIWGNLAHAWGPLAHMTFNCLAQYPTLSVNDCITTVAGGTFAVASDMPDAFGFGAFNITNDPSWECGNLTYVHDPVFAGHMVLMASQLPKPNQGFDAVAFARGFVGHIMGDLVGFNVPGGILCTPLANSCSATNILYMPEWGFMSALDAQIMSDSNITAARLPLPNDATIGDQGYSFISNATFAYNKINPKFRPVSAYAIKQCATYWAGNMNYVYKRAQFYNSNPTNMASLATELDFFRPGGSVLTWLKQQVGCAAATITQYLTLLDSGVTPEDAIPQILAYVKQQYMQGHCTPSSSTPSFVTEPRQTKNQTEAFPTKKLIELKK